MRIVILDGYVENPGDLSWDPIAAFGDLTVYQDLPDTTAEVIARIGDAEIAILNKTQINQEVIDHVPNLRLICEMATGYNNIDVAYAARKGITVCNVPAYGTMAVAQYTFALLLEICSKVALHNKSVHEGVWCHSNWSYWETPLTELAGKTIGIIGLGRIGKQVAKIADAMGMRVLANSRTEKKDDGLPITYTDLDTLYAESDVITLHCPLFPETVGMINRNTIAKMKDGVILLNTGRGGLVVDADLAEALQTGKVGAAGLDVISTEPIREDNPLLSAPNCIITPHVAWAALECRQRIIDTTVDNMNGFLRGHPVNTVN